MEIFPNFISCYKRVLNCVLYYLYLYALYCTFSISYEKCFYPKPEINQYHVEGCNINTMNIENLEKDSLSQVYTRL